jgi:hypothetical protein
MRHRRSPANPRPAVADLARRAFFGALAPAMLIAVLGGCSGAKFQPKNGESKS